MEWVKKLKHTVWEGMEYGNTDKEKKERKKEEKQEGRKESRGSNGQGNKINEGKKQRSVPFVYCSRFPL